jgi:hypothetical protein
MLGIYNCITQYLLLMSVAGCDCVKKLDATRSCSKTSPASSTTKQSGTCLSQPYQLFVIGKKIDKSNSRISTPCAESVSVIGGLTTKEAHTLIMYS